MDSLLTIKGEELTIHPHALTIDYLRDIWKRDPGESQTNKYSGKNERVKHKARRELGWIWFMEHWQSPYQVYSDEATKKERIKTALKMPDDWVEDDTLKKSRLQYAEDLINSNEFLFTLKASKRAMVELAHFLKDVNLKDLDNNGKPIYKPKDITSAIAEMGKAQQSVEIMEKAVKAAQQINNRVRGGGEVGDYER